MTQIQISLKHKKARGREDKIDPKTFEDNLNFCNTDARDCSLLLTNAALILMIKTHYGVLIMVFLRHYLFFTGIPWSKRSNRKTWSSWQNGKSILSRQIPLGIQFRVNRAFYSKDCSLQKRGSYPVPWMIPAYYYQGIAKGFWIISHVIWTPNYPFAICA